MPHRHSIGIPAASTRISTNNWTWTNFTYSDGTKVYRDPNQHVQFVGLTCVYKWQ